MQRIITDEIKELTERCSKHAMQLNVLDDVANTLARCHDAITALAIERDVYRDEMTLMCNLSGGYDLPGPIEGQVAAMRHALTMAKPTSLGRHVLQGTADAITEPDLWPLQ